MAVIQYDLVLAQNRVAGIEFEERYVNLLQGSLITADSNNYPLALVKGTDGQILSVSDTEPTKLKWITPQSVSQVTYDLLAVTTTGGAVVRLDPSSGDNDDVKLTSAGATTVSYVGPNEISISSLNTTYSHKISAQTGGAGIDLDDSASGTDTVKLLGDSIITVTPTNASVITLTHKAGTKQANTYGTDGISSLTVDAYGHITEIYTDTYLTSQSSSKNVVGNAGTDTANEAVSANTNQLYLNHLEDNAVTSSHGIKGTGSVKVSSDSSGNITIDAPTLAVNDAMIFVGSVNGSGVIQSGYNSGIITQTITLGTTTINDLVNYSAGWTFKVMQAGTVIGANVEIGDMIICTNDYQDSFSVNHWNIIQNELDNVVFSANAFSDGYIAVYDATTTSRNIKGIQRLPLANFPEIATNTILGNNTAGTAAPIALSVNNVMNMLWQPAPAAYNSNAASVGLLAHDENFDYIYVSRVANVTLNDGVSRWGRIPLAGIW